MHSNAWQVSSEIINYFVILIPIEKAKRLGRCLDADCFVLIHVPYPKDQSYSPPMCSLSNVQMYKYSNSFIINNKNLKASKIKEKINNLNIFSLFWAYLYFLLIRECCITIKRDHSQNQWNIHDIIHHQDIQGRNGPNIPSYDIYVHKFQYIKSPVPRIF